MELGDQGWRGMGPVRHQVTSAARPTRNDTILEMAALRRLMPSP
jgi:hypothetical protein